MTRILCAVLMMFIGFNSYSASSYLSCTNGTIEEVGDGLFTANFFDDAINFQIYEGSVSIGALDLNSLGSTTTIMDVNTTYFVEGEVEKVVVDAIITMSKDNKTAKLAYSLNKESFRSLDLSCKEMPYNNPKQ